MCEYNTSLIYCQNLGLVKNRCTPFKVAILTALLFLILATTYSIITPIFETPDELWHYPFVWHLAHTGQLPVQNPARPQLWGQEGSQPPLYYALTALLTAPIPAADLPDLIYRNPHADIGVVTPDGNANIVVHTKQERWPWRGAVLAIHLARFFSILLGTGTVLIAYALGRLLWPERPTVALLAMGFVAFNPMFLFISASVNNDNLITFLASLTVWWLVWLVIIYGDRRPPLRYFSGLGLLAGLATLTKVSGLGLAGLVGLTLLGWGWSRRSWRIALLGNGMVGLVAVAVAGWWYWRNFVLYGDWTGIQTMIAMMGSRPVTPTLTQLISELPGLLRSFWGLFGYFSLPLPTPVYWMLNLLLATGLAGLFLAWFRSCPSRLRRAGPILIGWQILLITGLILWTLRTPASQGRLLFPGLSALAVLWAIGWLTIVPTRLYALPPFLLLIVATWTPGSIIAPAYSLPTPLATVPASTRSVEVIFDQMVTLEAYETDVTSIQPGDSISLTLYWQANQQIDTDYTAFIHLLDENDLVIAQRNLFHGPGVYPTSQWAAGEQFGDTYVLKLPRTTFAPANARFEVGLYDHKTGVRLPASNGTDNVRFGEVKIEPLPGDWPNSQAVRFENGISLIGYSLDRRLAAGGDTINLTLYWQSKRALFRDYKVFVHLVGSEAHRIAQHDSEPQNGTAPTSSWQPEQVVSDPHPLNIALDAPPGAYGLEVGLYEGDTGRRLRVLHNGETPVQTDSMMLSGVRIVAKN